MLHIVCGTDMTGTLSGVGRRYDGGRNLRKKGLDRVGEVGKGREGGRF